MKLRNKLTAALIFIFIIAVFTSCYKEQIIIEPEVTLTTEEVEIRKVKKEYFRQLHSVAADRTHEEREALFCVKMLRWSGKCWYIPLGTVDSFGDTIKVNLIRLKQLEPQENCMVSGRHLVCDKSVQGGYRWEAVEVSQFDVKSCN